MDRLPLARRKQLVWELVDDELVIYDQATERVHSLNPSAAALWRACDGNRDLRQLTEYTGLDGQAVDEGLARLDELGLLSEYTPPGAPISRRGMLRRAAIAGAGAGVALPVIHSAVVPPAAAATSLCTHMGAVCVLTWANSANCSGTANYDSCKIPGAGVPATPTALVSEQAVAFRNPSSAPLTASAYATRTGRLAGRQRLLAALPD